MPAKITSKKIMTEEPYRSILHLLAVYKGEGLTLKEIHYVLIKDHHLKYISAEMHGNLDEKNEEIAKLLREKKLKKYEPKIVKKRRSKSKKRLTKEAEKAQKIRNNVRNFLLNMMEVDAIDFKDKRYFIKETFYLEYLREDAKEYLDFWKNDHILNVGKILSYNGNLPRFLVLGISENLYSLFDDNEKNNLRNNLRNIENELNNITNLKNQKIEKIFTEKFQTALKIFKDENKQLGSILENVDNVALRFLSELWMCYFLDTSRPLLGKNKAGILEKEQWYIFNGFSEEIISNWTTQEYIKKWTKEALGKEYDIELSDIKKILDFIFNQIDVIYDYIQRWGISLVFHNELREKEIIALKFKQHL